MNHELRKEIDKHIIQKIVEDAFKEANGGLNKLEVLEILSVYYKREITEEEMQKNISDEHIQGILKKIHPELFI